MKRFLAAALCLIFLVSCGAPAETTDLEDTVAPAETTMPETSAPETDAPETDAPETSTPETEASEEMDEPSAVAEISPSENGSYKIVFANGHEQTFDVENISAAFEKAKEQGYKGSLIDLAVTSASAVEARLAVASGLGAKGFGKALAILLENYEQYFRIDGGKLDGEVKITETEGYMGQTGVAAKNSPTQTYRYTQKISVVGGQTVSIVSDGNALGMRFVATFKGDVADASTAMIDANCRTTEFIVPEGVTHIVATYRYTGKEVYAVLIGGEKEVEPVLKNKVDAEKLIELATGVQKEFYADLSATADTLKDGYIYLEDNDVMHNKVLRLTFNVNALEEGQIVTIGHGETSYGGSGVELTKDYIRVYKYFKERVDVCTQDHGLDISGTVEFEVKAGFGKATVRVETDEDVFVSDNIEWNGRQGKIFAKSSGGAELSDVKAEWRCDDYGMEIWLFGDSYFSTVSADRWPYYMFKDGYTDYFMSGYPGRASKEALTDFKCALEHATPKYAIWCLGMNNTDSETAINAVYKAATEEFIAICKAQGIIPILSTIPNTPNQINVHKNEWVKASGYRYIDFAAAVDGEEIRSSWASGMLSSDKVHPAAPGAEALYKQFLKDFPEIKG